MGTHSTTTPSLGGMRQPNEHGVYQPTETLELPNPKSRWRGAPLAEIDLLELPDGWRSSIGAMLNASGRGEPITIRTAVHPTRDAALLHGIERLRKWLAKADEPQVPMVLRWLDTLIPEQPDLFGAAA